MVKYLYKGHTKSKWNSFSLLFILHFVHLLWLLAISLYLPSINIFCRFFPSITIILYTTKILFLFMKLIGRLGRLTAKILKSVLNHKQTDKCPFEHKTMATLTLFPTYSSFTSFINYKTAAAISPFALIHLWFPSLCFNVNTKFI